MSVDDHRNFLVKIQCSRSNERETLCSKQFQGLISVKSKTAKLFVRAGTQSRRHAAATRLRYLMNFG